MVDRPYTPEEVASRWRCSPRHVRNLIASGKLAHFRVGRLIRIPPAAVEAVECVNPASNSAGVSGSIPLVPTNKIKELDGHWTVHCGAN